MQQYLALAILLISLKLYRDHRQTGYAGPYNDSGSYDTISPMKHDLLKQLTLDVFPILVFGLATGEQLYNPNNMLNSIVGRVGVGLAAYVVYYQLVEPYLNARVQRF